MALKKEHGTDGQGERNPQAKLSEEDVLRIRAAYPSGEVSHRDLAEATGVSPSAIQLILNGERWPHVCGHGDLDPREALEQLVEDGEA